MANSSTPQTLRGFRDFLPEEKRQRDVVEAHFRVIFERHGFAPLETPTLEYASLLLGKYGDEADKLVYTFDDKGDRRVGLRYDQTVPTARVLAQYQHLLPRYFRRYQIQNVFRADKPQKGRYREFKQCDCDIFGSTSPIADAEILAVFYAGFVELGLRSLIIEVNDRQTLLSALSPFTTPEVNVFSIIQSIDKLDKVPANVVAEELQHKGLTIDAAQDVLRSIEKAEQSDSLQKIVAHAIALGIPAEALKFNPKLARGLDYYTGMIFEGRLPEYDGGSVGGGGRYNKLLNDLAGVDLPAVGFGIGFDRAVEAAVRLGKIPAQRIAANVLVTVFDEACLVASLRVTTTLRAAGIATELYPELDKLPKQLKLADQKQIPFVIIIGEREVAENTVTLKNMISGEQTTTAVADVIEKLCAASA